MLRRAVRHGRLPPAYLFTGPEGVGRRQVAHALAKSMFCPVRGKDDFCDECSVCQRVDSGNFPDVIMLSDSEGSIRIEVVRDVYRVLLYRPGEGERKVIIFDGAEHLTTSAANSLLKMLEEPPGGALFILIARGLEGLLPTVVSRCQRVAFAPLQTEEIAEYLARTREIPTAEANAIAASAQGSMARALAVSPESRQRFRELVERVILGGEDELLSEDPFSSSRTDVLAELELFRGFLRDCLVMKLAREEEPGAGGLINPDVEDLVLREQGRHWEDLFQRLEVIEEAISALRANANTRLVIDRIILGMR